MLDTFKSNNLGDVVFVAMGQGKHWKLQDGGVIAFPSIKIGRIGSTVAVTHYHVSHGPTTDRVIYPLAQLPSQYAKMLARRPRCGDSKRLAEGIAGMLADRIADGILAEIGEVA